MQKKEIKSTRKSKKHTKGITGKILLTAILALILGLFVGNGLFPATQYKKNYTQNTNYEFNTDMSPRLISVNEGKISFEQVAPQVSCCVVGIQAINSQYSSIGSGVCVADNGYILTNQHVINGAEKIYILLADGSNTSAQLIWQDTALDLAILKCKISLPWLEIADIEEAEVGEPVMAIGTPLSLQFQHSHTAGIISALNRMIAVQSDDGQNYMQNLIQHDASINPGNSGGPAITLNGKVIGINTLKLTEAEGIGFAIPAYIIKPILSHIQEDGFYNTVYLGIYGYDSTIAKYYGTDIDKSGVFISQIDTSGPLAQANIKSGDIITKIENQEINTMLDLRVQLYNHKVGDNITITLMRDNDEFTVNAILQKHPNAL